MTIIDLEAKAEAKWRAHTVAALAMIYGAAANCDDERLAAKLLDAAHQIEDEIGVDLPELQVEIIRRRNWLA